MPYNHAIIVGLKFLGKRGRQGDSLSDDEEQYELDDVGVKNALPDCLRELRIVWKVPPTCKIACILTDHIAQLNSN